MRTSALSRAPGIGRPRATKEARTSPGAERDDKASEEGLRSARPREAGPRVRAADEGVRENTEAAREWEGLLFRGRAPLHDGFDTPRDRAEQDDQGRGRPLAADAGAQCARPAGVRHARPPDRGSGREVSRHYEQAPDRGTWDREVRDDVPPVLSRPPREDDGAVPGPRGMVGLGQ